MTPDSLPKHLALAFLLALVAYAVFYSTIEHRRTRLGPWQVSFKTDGRGTPAIFINQPSLAITNQEIAFAGGHASSTGTVMLRFSEARPVPFDVPFGQCLFLDTMSLPGTVVLNLFGHQLQLLPRALTIDGTERSWRSGETIALSPTNRLAPGSQQ